MLLGLASYHAFMRRPTFVALEERLSYDDLRAELAKPAVKAAILAEADLPPDPHKQFQSLTENMPHMVGRLFVLGDDPDYEPTPATSIAGIAAATGADPMEILYDSMVAGDLLLGAFTNYAEQSNDALAEMLQHPDTVIGLSDGGAHSKMICDASSPTTLLIHWARDRTRGPKLPIELLVKKQTFDTANAMGLVDRGTIEVGKKADLNVIDHANLKLHRPRSVDDLPAGGRRILQDAEGYVATIVSGVVTRRHDRDTGARPGRLIRAGSRP
jgi:N-acyl-D-aspartate/D-glutamate deacylase